MANDTTTLSMFIQGLKVAISTQNASDGELVKSFASSRDEGAFTALVRRHGPMVWGVCLRLLGNHDDAADAFQDTFLVFARKAASLPSRDMVGSWLYGTAQHKAQEKLRSAARRRPHEAAVPVRVSTDPLTEISVREAQGIVDRELARPPEKLRAPLVLCCLEGLAREEAAGRLGWTPGQVKSRLEQARELLCERLTRRGLTLPAAMLSIGMLGTTVQAAVPTALEKATITAALASRATRAGFLLSAKVTTLAKVGLSSLAAKKLHWAAVLVALVVAGIGIGWGVSGSTPTSEGHDTQAVVDSISGSAKDALPGPVPEKDSRPRMVDAGGFRIHLESEWLVAETATGQVAWRARLVDKTILKVNDPKALQLFAPGDESRSPLGVSTVGLGGVPLGPGPLLAVQGLFRDNPSEDVVRVSDGASFAYYEATTGRVLSTGQMTDAEFLKVPTPLFRRRPR
jgi:RNA polymerase sigma factor (sigma-70 family)